MKVKSESEVAQLFPTLIDPMDHRPSGSSVHGILQARVLEWGATALSRGSLLACPKSGALICFWSSLSLVPLFLKEAKEKFNGISHGGGREQST